MDLRVLFYTLSLTSVKRKEIEEYMTHYLTTFGLVILDVVMEELDKEKHKEELDELVSLVHRMEKHKTSLDIGDEEKEKELMDDFEKLQEKIRVLPDSDRISKRVEEALLKEDKEILKSIMQSCSREDRERIIDVFEKTINHLEKKGEENAS